MEHSKLYKIGAILLVISLFASVLFGAVELNLETIWGSFHKWITGKGGAMTMNERIFMEIRLPRAILTLIVGASLALGGVLMQGLFLNPIVEPGLIGTSSGAAFGAALYFAFGANIDLHQGEWTLPIAACVSGAVATWLVYALSARKKQNKTSIVSLLLVGIAINALFLSGIGFLSYISRDPQARSITFWNLGTLSGANWKSVLIVGSTAIVSLIYALQKAKSLNALMLGESEAGNLGIQIKRLKLQILAINILLISVATAFTGVIAFVGLVVPHILRLMGGSDSRYLMWGSVMLGGVLLSAADICARLFLAPAELPIGIVTTIVGVPVFIYLLRKNEYYF